MRSGQDGGGRDGAGTRGYGVHEREQAGTPWRTREMGKRDCGTLHILKCVLRVKVEFYFTGGIMGWVLEMGG